MTTESKEEDKHFLKFDRPHLYTCTCGMEYMMFVSDKGVTEKVLKYPKNVEYLPCGHAICARNEKGDCQICINRG